ncbi:MAG: hypothetical protein ACO1QB_00950 [Verrucomicrobiales bacterium]
MPATYKLLLLDDDDDVLNLYREIFSRLPSEPEIASALSGARAVALLEAEPFGLLITNFKGRRSQA